MAPDYGKPVLFAAIFVCMLFVGFGFQSLSAGETETFLFRAGIGVGVLAGGVYLARYLRR